MLEAADSWAFWYSSSREERTRVRFDPHAALDLSISRVSHPFGRGKKRRKKNRSNWLSTGTGEVGFPHNHPVMSFTAPAAHHPAVPPFHTRGTTPRTQPYTGYLWRHLARPASQSYPANVPAGQPLRRRRGAAGCRERAGVSTKRLVAGGAPCLSPPASCLQEGVPAPRRPVGGLGGPARGRGGHP